MQSVDFVHLVHAFSQPPSKVWQAWTDAAIVKMWFGSDPHGTVLKADLDVRVNGAFRVKFANSDGTEYTANGIYKEIELNKRLAFTWGWEDRPQIQEFVFIEFRPENEGTLMSFEHQDIDKDTTHNYAEGWRTTFRKLERALDQLAGNA